MSAEHFSGNMEDFEAAAARCPFLNSLGESALAEIRTELQAAKLPNEAGTTSEPQATHIANRQVEGRATKPALTAYELNSESEQSQDIITTPQPLVVEVTKEAEIRHILDLKPILPLENENISPSEVKHSTKWLVTQKVPEEIRTPQMVAEQPNPIAAVRQDLVYDQTDMPVTKPEVVHSVAPTPEQQANTSPIEELIPKPEVPAKSPLSKVPTDVPQSEILPSTTEKPLTMETLLETPAELASEINEATKVAEEVIPFSEQAREVIEQSVAPARQEQAKELLAQAVDLAETIAQEAGDPTGEFEDLTEAKSEESKELERVVAELLQMVGLQQPDPEQIERFIALLTTEVLNKINVFEAPEYIDLGMHEQLQGMLPMLSRLHLPGLRSHQLLGRLILAQPIAA